MLSRALLVCIRWGRLRRVVEFPFRGLGKVFLTGDAANKMEQRSRGVCMCFEAKMAFAFSPEWTRMAPCQSDQGCGVEPASLLNRSTIPLRPIRSFIEAKCALEVSSVKNVAVIATHHKTGTVWMRSVFQRIAKSLKLKFVYVKELEGRGKDALIVPSIILADHSAFPNCRWILKHPETRIFHLIRDPRDVVVSAMHYHRTADEPWLHKPWRSFDGLTYQEKTNSLQDDHARYIFEMRYSARKTIRAMRKWNYKRTNSFEGRYEDLIADFEAETFTKILRHLGFDDHELESGRQIFQANSLFGMNAKDRRPHIRSGEGQQWKSTFNPDLANEFIAQFGRVLIDLGYEPDNTWIGELRPAPNENASSDMHGVAG
jgi:hypothetical protein